MSAPPKVAVPPVSAPAPARPARRDPYLPRRLAAHTMSMVGDSVVLPGAAWAAARSGSPTQAGLVLAVGAVPRALGGGLRGALTQTVTEPGYLGRVISVATPSTRGIAPPSYPVTGAAVGLWGTGPVYAVSDTVRAAGGVLGPACASPRRAELPGG